MVGTAAIAVGVVTANEWTQAAGSYGFLLVLSGAWTVGGLAVLSRSGRHPAKVPATTRIAADSRKTFSR
jgi:hypothetical protein